MNAKEMMDAMIANKKVIARQVDSRTYSSSNTGPADVVGAGQKGLLETCLAFDEARAVEAIASLSQAESQARRSLRPGQPAEGGGDPQPPDAP